MILIKNYSRWIFSSLKKLVIDDIDTEKNFYFLMKYFSDIPIENLKLKYLTIPYSRILLRFNKLKKLDITITSKKNENIIFDLLLLNKHRLKKLKIGVYTSKDIDEKKLVNIIEDNLRLEYIDIRSDLLTPKMLFSNIKTISDPFVFTFEYLSKLTNIINLRITILKNSDLNLLLNQLELVESISLWGTTNNYEIYSDEDKINYPFLFDTELYDNILPYDGSSASVSIRSPYLKHLFLNGFTISDFELKNPEKLRYFTIEDVYFKCNVFLPKVLVFTVENIIINPLHFDIHLFKLSQCKELNIHNVLLRQSIIFNKLEYINIQNSMIRFCFYGFLQKHKKLKEVLFYNNKYDIEYDQEKLESYAQKKKIHLMME